MGRFAHRPRSFCRHSDAKTLLTLARAAHSGGWDLQLLRHQPALTRPSAAQPLCGRPGCLPHSGLRCKCMAAASLDGPGVPRLDDQVFDAAMQAFNELAARPIKHACKRPDCLHLYTSEVLGAKAAAREEGTPLARERTEGDADQLETYAFGRRR
jgi:hypothetical protein